MDRNTLTQIIALLGLIVAILVFLFGEGILRDRDSSANEATSEIPDSSIVSQQDSSTSSESSNPPLSGVPGATQRCEEFQGIPIVRDSITTEQIEMWRQIGKTDRNETARIIYCEIQQVPNYEGFTEGDEIPSGVLIAADLGFNWNSMYPESLERLVHDGGGWGAFLTLKSFEVQHADDLPNDVGGQYWVVNQ
ncbi:hypothetical protein [Candidatus Leptofilum sp.]|uniref:hypothetical protein n=1 Tax=Candidatus Leptofilum sp. TaxID=3241576 RepID=UPI003B5B9197